MSDSRKVSVSSMMNPDEGSNKKEPRMPPVHQQDSDTETDGEYGADFTFENFETDYDKPRDKKPEPAEEKPRDIENIFNEPVKAKTVEEDLQILNKLSKGAKPRKFDTPPRWATKWKAVKTQTTTPTTESEPSIGGFTPEDDVNKTVQEWLFSHLSQLSVRERKCIELEQKFGKIMLGRDVFTLPCSTQTIVTSMDLSLRPHIDDRVFKQLHDYLHNLANLPEQAGKFTLMTQKTKDSVYRKGGQGEMIHNYRVSTDMDTGRVLEVIEKKHVSSLLLYSPRDAYDIKLTLNLELPEDPAIAERFKDKTPESVRIKSRSSLLHNGSKTRIDLTRVENNGEKTCELELEIKTGDLVQSFEKLGSGDVHTFPKLLRGFMNNGVLCNRKMSEVAQMIRGG